MSSHEVQPTEGRAPLPQQVSTCGERAAFRLDRETHSKRSDAGENGPSGLESPPQEVQPTEGYAPPSQPLPTCEARPTSSVEAAKTRSVVKRVKMTKLA